VRSRGAPVSYSTESPTSKLPVFQMCFAEFNSASALRFRWPDSWCPRMAALGCPPRIYD